MENQVKKQKPWYKKTWVIIVGMIFILGLIANIGGSKDRESKSNTASSTDSVATEKTEAKSNWTYMEDVDKMTNKKTYFASCESTNQIEFEAPYEGGSIFTLTVRNLGKGNEIVLNVSKGQFMTSVMSSENCRVKFDEEQTINFDYNSAADASADVIFFDNPNKFLKKLKTAKKLKIEAPFAFAGRQVIEFDIAGLTWKR